MGAPSKLSSLGRPSDPLLPRWLHDPRLPLPVFCREDPHETDESGCGPGCGTEAGLQNTDPFVFGGAFKYFICKQTRGTFANLTALARLERGSMILFGSTSGKDRATAFFQPDTVFIKLAWLAIRAASRRQGFVEAIRFSLPAVQ